MIDKQVCNQFMAGRCNNPNCSYAHPPDIPYYVYSSNSIDIHPDELRLAIMGDELMAKEADNIWINNYVEYHKAYSRKLKGYRINYNDICKPFNSDRVYDEVEKKLGYDRQQDYQNRNYQYNRNYNDQSRGYQNKTYNDQNRGYQNRNYDYQNRGYQNRNYDYQNRGYQGGNYQNRNYNDQNKNYNQNYRGGFNQYNRNYNNRDNYNNQSNRNGGYNRGFIYSGSGGNNFNQPNDNPQGGSNNKLLDFNDDRDLKSKEIKDEETNSSEYKEYNVPYK
ncbi:hypothetical protein A0H76_103 [Hepatospora eriocheir]|uniref:C3H1-type domain-containing protein n=1 Tax=Hepatospora eriocheir TaxID=1081669 RepID=A0A1X0QJ81_9MICR|nr:hypothetical protein A0H76_103 [Hepatospora eriocheir]